MEWCNIQCNFFVSFISKKWLIYLFATSLSCKITCVDPTKSRNILNISPRVTCTINIGIKETFKILMLSFLEVSDHFFERYFEAVNDQKEYFRLYGKICCMILLNNMLMISSHIVFNIPLDLIYGKCFACKSHTYLFYICSGYC